MSNPRFKSRLLALLLLLLTAVLCIAIAPARSTLAPSVSSALCTSALSCNTSLMADVSLIQQGKTLYDAGKFEDAIVVLQKAAKAYEVKGDALRQAIAFSNLTLAYQQRGQWQPATESIATSVSLLDKPNSTQL